MDRPHASADQSKNLQLTYRKGEGRALTFELLDEDGDPFDSSDFLVTIEVYDVFDKETNLISLTENTGGGITNGGVSGLVVMEPSDGDVNIDEGDYEYRWKAIQISTGEPMTWFSAAFHINNSPRKEDTPNSETVTVAIGPIMIQVTVILGIPNEHYRGLISVAANLFPEVGGAGDMKLGGGRPKRGDWYITTDGGTLKDADETNLTIPARSTLYYIGTNGGNMQLGENWKVNQG